MSFLLDEAPSERLPVLTLPAPTPPARRAALPLFASLVPIVGAVVLWLVLSSPYALIFAILGPFLAIASMIDGARGRKRDRARDALELTRACKDVARTIEECHDVARDERWLLHPDVALLVERPDDWWRAIPERRGTLVLGTGAVRSSLEVAPGDERAEAVRLRERALWLSDAPLVVPLREGIFVRGPLPLAEAVVRALVAQTALVHPPAELRLLVPETATGARDDEGAESWVHRLPHARAVNTGNSALRLALCGPGENPPAADAVIAWGSGVAPSGCAATIDVAEPDSASLSWRTRSQAILVEALSVAQADAVARMLSERAADSDVLTAPEPLALREVLAELPAKKEGVFRSLIAPVGRRRIDGRAIPVDLVADGPHAVVVGTTGSGKSELLITWVSALASRHSPAELTFLLADFKGGTAFDRLAVLPHVTGVITDLEPSTALRAVESLGAEMRRRERELAECGARDVGDTDIARLVIVVDEFAALVNEQPELHSVFADIAARGRALGMHLILGTQRHSGVIRDALLANCPLRVALRLQDPIDSRALLGTEDAAMIPGGTAGRGSAYLLRAGDQEPVAVQIALSDDATISGVAARWDGAPHAAGPWLPPLPAALSLSALSGAPQTLPEGRDSVILGLADEPRHQRQSTSQIRSGDTLLAVGGSRMGKSALIDLVAQQRPSALRIPHDPEVAWDLISECFYGPPSTLLIDDLDALVAQLPGEYAPQFLHTLEGALRAASRADSLIVCTAQRAAGALGRLLDLFSHRAILHTPSKSDYLALGGVAENWQHRGVPGRAWMDGLAVHLALPQEPRSLPDFPLVDALDFPTAFPVAVVTNTARRWLSASAVPVLPLAELPAQQSIDEIHDQRGSVALVGDAEQWQQRWALLQEARDRHAVVVSAECASDARSLLGLRELPPFIAPGAPRGWLFVRGRELRRVSLPLDSA